MRDLANLVSRFERGGGRHGVSAALEFAVTQLQLSEIMVMGHGSCGGVHAAPTDGFRGKPPAASPRHGAYFAIADGKLNVMDDRGTFHPA